MLAAISEPDLWLELKRRIRERRLAIGEEIDADHDEDAVHAEEARLSAEIEQLRSA